jgi:hypothetical protein
MHNRVVLATERMSLRQAIAAFTAAAYGEELTFEHQ